MFFLVISPQRHRASQSLHREIHFSDRLLKRGVNKTGLINGAPSGNTTLTKMIVNGRSSYEETLPTADQFDDCDSVCFWLGRGSTERDRMHRGKETAHASTNNSQRLAGAGPLS